MNDIERNEIAQEKKKVFYDSSSCNCYKKIRFTDMMFIIQFIHFDARFEMSFSG